MELEKVIEKLKETGATIKEAQSMIDDRAANAPATRKLVQGQRGLLDTLVGLVKVGAVILDEPEPEPEPEPEAEPDEFDVDSLKAVYTEPEPEPEVRKAAVKKAARRR